jgi:rubrerythrin
MTKAEMPQTPEAANAYIYTVETPTIDDFKLMMQLEAAGQGFYAAMANAAPSEAVKQLLAKNGQEELGHAHRVSRVIKQIYGEDVAVPGAGENPFHGAPESISVTKEMLEMIVQGEFGGEALYERWAVAVNNAEAAKLLRLNGKEERRHGERLQEAQRIMAS